MKNKEVDFEKVISHIHSYRYMCYPPHYPLIDVWKEIKENGIKNFENNIKKYFKNSKREIGVYVNVPFCATKCSFCFLTIYLYSNKDYVKKFIEGLKKEISIYSKLLSGKKIKSIYMGGGTVSIFNPNELDEIFKTLAGEFKYENKLQFSIETSPDFIDEEKIYLFKKYGVNLLMLGVQTFNQKAIKKFNRLQNVNSVEKKIKMIKDNRIKFNIDLICGLDTLDEKKFIEQVKRVIKLRPDLIHLNKFKPSKSLEHKKQIENLQKKGIEFLAKNGYKILDEESAAINNFSGNIQGNMDFLINSNILGIGPGSMGHINSKFRYFNHLNINKYHELLNQNLLPLQKLLRINYKDEAEFYLLTYIFNQGINIKEAQNIFEKEPLLYLKKKIIELLKQNLIRKANESYIAKEEKWFEITKSLYNLNYIKEIADKYGFYESTKNT